MAYEGKGPASEPLTSSFLAMGAREEEELIHV
jgi:hypothetical protein